MIFAVVAKITLGKFETSFSRLAKQRKTVVLTPHPCGERSPSRKSTDCVRRRFNRYR
jgi:hypothetical protein